MSPDTVERNGQFFPAAKMKLKVVGIAQTEPGTPTLPLIEVELNK